jgi:hypothetical protein
VAPRVRVGRRLGHEGDAGAAPVAVVRVRVVDLIPAGEHRGGHCRLRQRAILTAPDTSVASRALGSRGGELGSGMRRWESGGAFNTSPFAGRVTAGRGRGRRGSRSATRGGHLRAGIVGWLRAWLNTGWGYISPEATNPPVVT